MLRAAINTVAAPSHSKVVADAHKHSSSTHRACWCSAPSRNAVEMARSMNYTDDDCVERVAVAVAAVAAMVVLLLLLLFATYFFRAYLSTINRWRTSLVARDVSLYGADDPSVSDNAVIGIHNEFD